MQSSAEGREWRGPKGNAFKTLACDLHLASHVIKLSHDAIDTVLTTMSILVQRPFSAPSGIPENAPEHCPVCASPIQFDYGILMCSGARIFNGRQVRCLRRMCQPGDLRVVATKRPRSCLTFNSRSHVDCQAEDPCSKWQRRGWEKHIHCTIRLGLCYG